MVKGWRVIVCLGSVGCLISVSANQPSGGYDVVSFRVTPADGAAHAVTDAGRFEFGALGNLDPSDLFECTDTGLPCGDAVSILAYDWVGGGLVPLWAPERVLFHLPEWDGPNERWLAPIPVGNLSCALSRTSKRPTVLVGEDCSGPDGGPFDVELVMDR